MSYSKPSIISPMYSKEIEAVRGRLSEKEAFVSVKSGNVRYLSYRAIKDPIASAVVIDKEKEIAIVSSLEMNRASDLLDMDMKVYSPYPGIKKDGTKFVPLLKKVCHDKNVISDARIVGMKTKINDLIAPLRIIKSKEEIELIKKANKMTRSVDLDKIVTSEKSEMMIAREVEDAMLRNGADGLGFDTIVACGKHTTYSHHEPGRTKFRDVAIIDYGARYKGYCADVTRTVLKGNERLEKIRDMLEVAIDGVVEKYGEGSKCSDIAKDLRTSLGKYSKFFYHGPGHGIGLEIHENPFLSINSKEIVRKDMVFTIEPGIYIRGLGGVRVEDDFYVDGKIRRIGGSAGK